MLLCNRCDAAILCKRQCTFGTSVMCNMQPHTSKGSVCSTLHSVQCTLNTVHCTVQIAQWTLALPSVRGRGTWLGGILGTATIRQQHKYCQLAKILILIPTMMRSTTSICFGTYYLGVGHQKKDAILIMFQIMVINYHHNWFVSEVQGH